MKRGFAVLVMVMSLVVPQAAFAGQGEGKAFHKGQSEKARAYREGERKEFREFKKTLEGKSEEEKAKAIAEYRKAHRAERQEFRKKMHEEKMAFLKDRLDKNKKLSDAEKEDLLKFIEDQHTKRMTHREGQRAENYDLLSQIANDPSLTAQQKKEAIKEHFKAQRGENKEFHKTMGSERKEFKGNLKTN